MRFAQIGGNMVLLFMAAAAFSTAGCAGKDKKGGDQQAKGKVDPKEDGKKDLKAGTKHDGWWCDEHGIPEHLCSLCSESVAAKLKKAGDWCKIHDRADSQCFKCDPSKYAKFEAMHEAKYGKKPERPPEDEFKK